MIARPESTTATSSSASAELESLYLVPHYNMHVFPDMGYIFPPSGSRTWNKENIDAPKNRKFRIDPSARFETYLDLRRMNSVNGTAKDLYMLVNGERTGEEVYLALLAKHEQPYGTMREKVFEFLQEMILRAHVTTSDAPVQVSHLRTGSEEYHHPPHLSIEVTSMCNIACLHCYGSFEQTRFDAIDADRLIQLMEQMKQKGFSSVELTGGECTTHPEFPRILSWCCENLCMVGVLTNAVNIREEIFHILARHRDKVLVQICINGNEEYHNKFTKSTIAYKRALSAITRLAGDGVYVRTPMNVTFENYDQIEETFEAVRAAGSCGWTMNLVDYDYGRAQDLLPPKERDELVQMGNSHAESPAERSAPNDSPAKCEKMTSDGLTCEDRFHLVLQALAKMKELEAKYPNFVRGTISGPVKEQMDWEGSCGAGRRAVYVASNGRIGLCPMSVETGIPGFGDLRTGDFGSAMNSEFSKHMAALPAPNDHDCIGPDGAFCPHRFEHRGCLLHGIMQYMKTPHTCWWGQKHDVQKLIDTGYHTLTKKPDGTWNLPELSHSGTGCGCASVAKGPSIVELQVTK